MSFQIKYRGRFPVQQKRPDGKKGCRGCGEPIPKGRQTWCSGKCYDTYCPDRVVWFVKQRDKGVCQICKADIFAVLRGISHWKEVHNHSDHRCKAEYDHITPMCEGGLTVISNIRTLCVPCHRAETRKLAKRRAAARRSMLQPDMFLGKSL